MKKKGFNTRSIHACDEHNAFGAHCTPIFQTSTFVFENAEQGARRFLGKEEGFVYTRLGNPTTRLFEKRLADLEGAEDACAFASGMGAISASVLSEVRAGDHVVCCDVVYGCTYDFFSRTISRFGVDVSFVDTSNPDLVRKAIHKNTKLVFIETPANPTMKLSDIAAISKLAHKAGLLLVVDNTFATPFFQKPIALGADVCIHSCTKYLGGHGDLIAGVVCGSKGHIKKARHMLTDVGAVLSPFCAWLILRGMKTLGVRMEKHEANALAVAKFLESHKKVERVNYPGLSSFPKHALAKKQMSGFSGMLSFELKGGIKAGRKLMNSVKLCSLAVSLGCVDSLVQHPASMTHAVVPREQKLKAGITDGLVRISVGIEDVEDIIADLEHALSKI